MTFIKNKDGQFMAIAIAGAFVVHLILLAANFSRLDFSEQKVEYKPLKIKLGNVEDLKKQKQLKRKLLNRPPEKLNPIEQDLKKLEPKVVKKQPKKAKAKLKATTKQVNKNIIKAKRRESISPAVIGNRFGNAEKSNEVKVQKYTKIISAWANNYLNDYLPEKRPSKVVNVFIRIDRAGNLLEHSLKTSTKIEDLDTAIMLAIKRASPYPKVPKDYPDDNKELGFIIPFTVLPK